ncbi:hypothetical protein Belba_1044 [Belliella baltica DSM 15883]|uniref:Activator of Hsp90 ATPase homologue 1/2-like C-terminal domain-containing protein n=1 Tax=Belliella baltica (strain DSM 15883 / CIP 108006 / LMG 21964 / BA134) TaxID=866536 RepID=I3Z365_BELBD|nr:SRPBCC domain-containing protein [Belliella baltica]AFL83683.1 hypothetical protein Belba_1044 [Belliella baltica DSM 15883]
MKKSEAPILVRETFDLSIELLWSYLTERELMIQWYFENIPEFQAMLGFETEFEVENEGRVFPHNWKVMAVTPFRKISYNWKYKGFAGDSTVTFELRDLGGKTELSLTHEVLEDFNDEIPEFSRASCQAGWTYFIKERLTRLVNQKSGKE